MKMLSNYIGGYTVINDVTARDKQRKDVQWTRAKSFDTFAPIGPCIETELDPMNQNISLRLNSDLKQNSNTKNMIFNVYELVEFISNIMTFKHRRHNINRNTSRCGTNGYWRHC